MALIVEDGTGLANADSYASVAFADSYFANRMTSNWDSSDSHKEILLRLATDHIDIVYGQRFKGAKSTLSQSLQFPRIGVAVDGFDLAENVVPIEVQRACCEFALAANTQLLMPNLTQGVKREKIDVIEIEYDEFSSRMPKFTKAYGLLAKYLIGGAYQCVVTRA